MLPWELFLPSQAGCDGQLGGGAELSLDESALVGSFEVFGPSRVGILLWWRMLESQYMQIGDVLQ